MRVVAMACALLCVLPAAAQPSYYEYPAKEADPVRYNAHLVFYHSRPRLNRVMHMPLAVWGVKEENANVAVRIGKVVVRTLEFMDRDRPKVADVENAFTDKLLYFKVDSRGREMEAVSNKNEQYAEARDVIRSRVLPVLFVQIPEDFTPVPGQRWGQYVDSPHRYRSAVTPACWEITAVDKILAARQMIVFESCTRDGHNVEGRDNSMAELRIVSNYDAQAKRVRSGTYGYRNESPISKETGDADTVTYEQVTINEVPDPGPEWPGK
jgi:hypothetical protein